MKPTSLGRISFGLALSPWLLIGAQLLDVPGFG